MDYPTVNTEYNLAWKTLEKYFKSPNIYPDMEWLVLNANYPKRKKQWIEIYQALITVIGIGKRQGWLTEHLDGRGTPVFLVHHKPPPVGDNTGVLSVSINNKR